MTEEEGKKEEEKLEFTPEGETLGYISLDQARVLAIEHARDNRDFYGPRSHGRASGRSRRDHLPKPAVGPYPSRVLGFAKPNGNATNPARDTG
tara:strand:+ start:3463 stop:3741 length:279 start_codon:yes stop_codon:yes gene_type:complete